MELMTLVEWGTLLESCQEGIMQLSMSLREKFGRSAEKQNTEQGFSRYNENYKLSEIGFVGRESRLMMIPAHTENGC